MQIITRPFSILRLAFFFVLAGTIPAGAAPVGVNPKDASFIQKAAQDSAAEVQITNLAQQRAQNPEVKQLAAKLHENHMTSNERLHEIAHDADVKMPTQSAKKDDAGTQRLSSLSGPAFDKAFLNEIVTGHEKEIAFYEKQKDAGKSTEVNGFVKETLPTLRQHLKEAKDLRQQLYPQG